MDAERGLDVGHVELEAGLADVIVLEAGVREPLPRTKAQSMERQLLDAVGYNFVVGREGTALDGRDVLGHVERVGGEVAVGADQAIPPPGADRVCGVLDDKQTVTIAKRVEGIHVYRSAP